MLKNSLRLRNLITLCTIILTSITFMGTASAGFLSSLLPTYTLSGKITNQNQEPLEGVTVVFAADGIGGQNRAVTDATGNYVLHPPAKTSGLLTVSKENYRIVRERNGGYYQSGSTFVSNYSLHPDWVSGKITNRDGEPLEGVKIMFEQNGGLAGAQTVFTDENGNYKYTVPADSQNYWMTIVKDGYQTLRDKPYLYGGNVYNYTLR